MEKKGHKKLGLSFVDLVKEPILLAPDGVLAQEPGEEQE